MPSHVIYLYIVLGPLQSMLASLDLVVTIQFMVVWRAAIPAPPFTTTTTATGKDKRPEKARFFHDSRGLVHHIRIRYSRHLGKDRLDVRYTRIGCAHLLLHSGLKAMARVEPAEWGWLSTSPWNGVSYVLTWRGTRWRILRASGGWNTWASTQNSRVTYPTTHILTSETRWQKIWNSGEMRRTWKSPLASKSPF